MKGEEVNKRRLAGLLGVSQATITAWVQDGCPAVSRAKGSAGNVYNTAQVFAWRMARAEAGVAGSPHERLIRAKASLAELELAIARGDTAPLADIFGSWERLFTEMRALLLRFPLRLAVLFGPAGKQAEAEALGREAVDEVLNALAGCPLPAAVEARRAAQARRQGS